MRSLNIIESFDNIKIFFLTGDFKGLMNKKRFNNLFHRVIFSNVSVHLLDNPDLNNILKDNACITLESVRHMTILKPEQKIEYLKRVHSMASKLKWNVCGIDLKDEKLKDIVKDMENITYLYKKE